MKLRKMLWLEIVLAMFALASGHLLAIGFNGEPLFAHWDSRLEHYGIWSLLVVGLVFIGISFVLVRRAQAALRLSNLSIQKCTPKKVVIACLSTSNATVESRDGKYTVTSKKKDGSSQRVELGGRNLDEDIDALNDIGWNWQQLLRGLRRHTVKDGHVYLIGSEDGPPDNHKPTSQGPIENDENRRPGSQRQIKDAEKLIKMYFKDVTIQLSQTPVDFENVKELVKCVSGIIREYKQQDFKDDDILIDVTGGPKTASIAGAVITLNTGVEFHYTSTHPPHECLAFDVSYTPPPASSH